MGLKTVEYVNTNDVPASRHGRYDEHASHIHEEWRSQKNPVLVMEHVEVMHTRKFPGPINTHRSHHHRRRHVHAKRDA